jgi:hypothetical protein
LAFLIPKATKEVAVFVMLLPQTHSKYKNHFLYQVSLLTLFVTTSTPPLQTIRTNDSSISKSKNPVCAKTSNGVRVNGMTLAAICLESRGIVIKILFVEVVARDIVPPWSL